MDDFYDTKNASSALEQSASEIQEIDDRRLASLTRGTLSNVVHVVEDADPQVWRLTGTGAEYSKAEELVFSIQGVIEKKMLPPVVENKRGNKAGPFIRQGVSLNGLGTATFGQVLDAIDEIYGLFSRALPEGLLEPSDSANREGEHILHASNRFLTPKKYASNLTKLEIPNGVDPRGILKAIVDEGEYAYCDDNEVQYFECKTDGSGKKRFNTVQPHIFRVGDIVEIQVSFVVTPVKEGRRKMRTVLRSIALLNGKFTYEANKKRAQTAIQPQQKPATLRLKRKIGYDTEHAEAEENLRQGNDPNRMIVSSD